MRGLDQMLELRRRALHEGARSLGWKTGFGSAAAMAQLGTDAPLVGFLTDRSLIEPGAEVSLAAYANPVLAGNVYHRGVVLGPERATSLERLRARVFRDGEQVAETDDVGALNGDPAGAALHVARTVGDLLRSGDVVITGSIVPPLAVAPGERYRYELDPVGSLELSFSSASSVSE